MHIDIARNVINCEIQGLKDLLNSLDEQFNIIVEKINNISGRVILSGMGKSGHIARKIAATLASTGTPAFYIHPAEASHGDLGMITKNDIVLLLSYSGETPELGPIIDYCKRFDIAIIGMSAKQSSQLMKAADFQVLLPNAPEASNVNAPTTSTIMMMAYGDAIAIALQELRNFTEIDFKIYHPGGNIGAKLLKVSELMHIGDELPLIEHDWSALEAILTITSKKFGCVGILNNEKELIGIVTDGDLRRNIERNFDKIRVSQIMTSNPTTIDGDTLAGKALAIMNAKSVTNLFIARNKKPIGIIHIHDLIRAGVV